MELFLLLKLYLALAFVLAIPGYFLSKFLLSKNWSKISQFEKIALVGGLSIAVVDFGMILMDWLSIKIGLTSLVAFIALFSIVFHFLSKKHPLRSFPFDEKPEKPEHFDSLRKTSYKQYLLFLIFLVLAVSIRALYISRGVMPQTTDLGHHMYWSKQISQTGALPEYGMPDFIIGEHLIFSAVQIISGLDYISAFPVIVTLLINVLSLFALMILAYETSSLLVKKKIAKQIAFLTFFVAGTFYAISDPQTKFVSGGVIGNIIGNFFIPLSLYLFIKTIKTRNSVFASMFILSLFTLAYTHHLSSFIFLYSFAGFLIGLFVLLTIGLKFPSKIFRAIKNNLMLFLKPGPLVFLAILMIFLVVIQEPSYLNTAAIDTAVGSPSKDTRIGLPLGLIVENTGPWRFFYGSLGLIAIVFLFGKAISKKKNENSHYPVWAACLVLVATWGLMIFLMSYRPAWLKVDIPSNRIASYITHPFTILASFGAVYLLSVAKNKLSRSLFMTLFVFVFGVGIISGMSDISESARDSQGGNELEVSQTYSASKYLAQIVEENDVVLKDHIYLSGDTWMKLFFMKAYRYPLSRSYLKRYEDVAKDRETCTRDMVAIPDSTIGKDCFNEYGVTYVVLKKGFDTAQFEKSEFFEKIYSSDSVVIYHRLNPVHL